MVVLVDARLSVRPSLVQSQQGPFQADVAVGRVVAGRPAAFGRAPTFDVTGVAAAAATTTTQGGRTVLDGWRRFGQMRQRLDDVLLDLQTLRQRRQIGVVAGWGRMDAAGP